MYSNERTDGILFCLVFVLIAGLITANGIVIKGEEICLFWTVICENCEMFVKF